MGWSLSGGGLDIQPSDNIETPRRPDRDPLVIKETRIDAIHGWCEPMDDAATSAPRFARAGLPCDEGRRFSTMTMRCGGQIVSAARWGPITIAWRLARLTFKSLVDTLALYDIQWLLSP